MARIGKPVRAFSMDLAKETHFPVNPCPRIPVYPYCREMEVTSSSLPKEYYCAFLADALRKTSCKANMRDDTPI